MTNSLSAAPSETVSLLPGLPASAGAPSGAPADTDFAALLAQPDNAAGDASADATAAQPALAAGGAMPLILSLRRLASASSAEPVAAAAPASVEESAEASALPDRDLLEAAAALLAPAMQVLTPPPAPVAVDAAVAGATVTTTADAAPVASLSVSVPGGPTFQTDLADSAAADPAAWGEQLAGALQEPPVPAAPGGAPDAAATATAPTPEAVASLEAELTLPAGHVVKLRRELPLATDSLAEAGQGEKIAEPLAPPSNTSEISDSAPKRNSLSHDEELDVDSIKGAGIAVAQDGSAMSSRFTPSTALVEPTGSAPALAAAAGQSAEHPVAGAGSDNLELFRPVAVAHRTVAAVAEIVDAQVASRLQPSPTVNLRLQLAGEDLAVRVELRDGEVHTRFRTESTELHTALAREWQALVSESPVRGARFADPVFSSASSGDQAGSSQDFAQQQQGQPRRPQAEEFFGSVGRSYGYADSGSASDESAAAARPLPSTSLHLSAVA